jgi:hypothetical protein
MIEIKKTELARQPLDEEMHELLSVLNELDNADRIRSPQFRTALA